MVGLHAAQYSSNNGTVSLVTTHACTSERAARTGARCCLLFGATANALALASCHRFDPTVTDLGSLKRLLTYSRRFVQSVHIRQLPSHLDLQILFDCMVK